MNNIIWRSNQNPPYGNGDQGAISDIIAVGESWAFHMGHFMADLKYATTPQIEVREQQILYRNGDLVDGSTIITTGLSAHVNLLEDFSPLRYY